MSKFSNTKKLLKKMLRDMASSKGQFISIILVVTTGVSFFAGLFIFMDSLTKNLGTFYDDHNLADIWAVYGSIDETGVERIRQIDGVTSAKGRLKLEGLSGDAADSREFAVYTLTKGNTMNTPLLTEGALPSSAAECILCRPTAEANGIRTGDTLSLSVGGRDFALTVSGLFLSPEYVFQVKDASVAIPDYKKFGIVFLHESMTSVLSGGDNYNEVCITLRDGADAQAVISKLPEAAKGYQYGYAYTRDKQMSYSIIDYKIQSIQKLAMVFPIIFFIVAAALMSISMSRLVASQRGQIGIMKALGTKTKTISFHYLSFAVATGLLGGVLGSVIGTTLLPGVIIGVITVYFSLPPVILYGGSYYALIGTALAILFGVAAAFLSCRSILRESAAGLMRPQPPKNAKKIWFEKRVNLWSKLSYKTKLILRNIFLNKRRAIIGSIGIISGCALIFASLALQGTYDFCMDDYMTSKNNYDLQVVPDRPDDGFEASLAAFGAVTKAAKLSGIITQDGEEIETMVTVLPASSPASHDADAVQLFNTAGERVYTPDDGVLVTQKFAEIHGISVGDVMQIKLVSAAGVSEITARAADICTSYFGQGVFVSFGALEKQNIRPAPTTYYLTASGSANDAAAALQSMEGVKAVYTKADLKEFMASAQDLISTIILVMVIASAILALAVMFNITSINIFDRRRDIATLRVLGFHHSEVGRLILTENLLLTAFGGAAGIGLGFLTQYALISFIGTNDTHFPFMAVWWNIPAAAGSVFLFAFIVNLLSGKKIRSIDMVESLKSVE